MPVSRETKAGYPFTTSSKMMTHFVKVKHPPTTSTAGPIMNRHPLLTKLFKAFRKILTAPVIMIMCTYFWSHAPLNTLITADNETVLVHI
jgi:hypothetical protein